MSPFRRFAPVLGVATAFLWALLSWPIGVGAQLAEKPIVIKAPQLPPNPTEDPLLNNPANAGPFRQPINKEASENLDEVRRYIEKEIRRIERNEKLRREGKPLLDEKPRWDEICYTLQTILQSDGGLVTWEVKDEQGKVTIQNTDARVIANQLLGSLPAEGREFYEQTYGGEAKRKLEDAIETMNRGQLEEVSRNYLHTKAGAQATALLGTYHLDRGRYQSAAQCFKDLLARPDTKDLTPATLFKAALALKRAGSTEQAERVWKLLERASNGDPVKLYANASYTLEQLRRELDRPVEFVSALNAGDWHLFRGSLNRNAQGIGGTPFMDARFTASMLQLSETDDKNAFDWIEQNLKDAIALLEQKHLIALPAFYPIAANNKVIYRSYDGVCAVAAKDDPNQNPPVKAGELLWKSRANYGLAWMVGNSGLRSKFENEWWKPFYRMQGPTGIFFENSLIGTLCHDGKSVYFVDDLAVPPHPTYMQQFGGNPQMMNLGPFQEAVFQNRLVSLELESGKVQWTLPDSEVIKRRPEDPLAEKETALTHFIDAHFLGVPLPVMGKLYVTIEKKGQQRLVCLDPNKISRDKETNSAYPELVWSLPLGSPLTRIPQDMSRRIQGVNLAYSEGMLVVPTNAGAVLFVNLMNRTIVKTFNYRQDPQATPDQPDPNVLVPPRRRPGIIPPNTTVGKSLAQERWRSSAPIIVGNRVYFTAYDSNSVLCLNLATGDEIWSSPREEADLYLAGVINDKVLIVSKGSMRAIDANQPTRVVWRLENTGIPLGLGVASNGVYYLPRRGSEKGAADEIWAIDIDKGKVLAQTKSRKKQSPGNLLFYEGDVYSQNPFALVAFPQLRLKLEEMNRRLAANPKDPIGLTERGELRLDDGQLVAAITDLRDALQFQPPAETREKAREKLYEAITELLQRNFADGEKYLDEYRTLCDIPIPENAPEAVRQKLANERLLRYSTYHQLLAKGRESQGKLLEAFDNYLAFGTLNGDRELVPTIDDPNTLVRADVWARGRIEQMIRRAAPEARRPLEQKISQEWNAVRQAGDLEGLRGFVKVFGPTFREGKLARLTLAERLIATRAEDAQREAEMLLDGLRYYAEEDPTLAAQAIETLARLMIDKNLMEDAVGMYAELGRDFAQVVVRDNRTGADLFQELITDKRFLPYLETPRQAWQGRIKGIEIPGGRAQMPQQSFTLDLQGELPPFFQRHRVVIDSNVNGGWQMRLIDRVTGEDRWKYGPLMQMHLPYGASTANFRLAQARGHLLLLHLNNMIYCFDLADKKKLWEFNLYGKSPVMNTNPPTTQFEADGSLRVLYPDGWSQKLGQVGLIGSNYVCLQTRDSLVALDPLRGTVLWTKANVSPRTQLLGDDRHIFLFETNSDNTAAPTRAVRAEDGVRVEVPDCSALFTSPKRLRPLGRNLLLFDDAADNKKVLRLYDPLSGKDLWRREVAADTQAVPSEDPSLVGLLTADGRISLIQIRNNKEVFQSRLDAKWLNEHLKNVNEPRLLLDRERVYLMLNRPAEKNVSVSPNVGPGMRTMRVNGHMYCFDRATGKRLWFTDEQLENQMLVLEQFQDLPVVLAVANQSRINNGVFEGASIRLVALEKQSGCIRFRKDFVNNGGMFYTLITEPAKGEVQFWRNDLHIRFSLEESPAAGTRVGLK